MTQSFQTEFTFTLPRGFVDASGQVHVTGQMRLATALDEIESVQEPRVQKNETFLPAVLLSRVVTQLGELPTVTPDIIAGLYVIDLSYLEDLYQRINNPEAMHIGAVCPSCSQQFQLQIAPLGMTEE